MGTQVVDALKDEAVTPVEVASAGGGEDRAKALDFVKRAYALRLKLGRIGTRRAVDLDLIDFQGADTELIGVTKELLDSRQLKAILSHDHETRAWVRQRALPSLLGPGWYLIPTKSLKSVDEYIQKRTTERAELVSVLVEALPELKEIAESRLKHLWVEEQFPTASSVREATVVSMRYKTFDTPASLKGVSEAILRRELEKAGAEAISIRDNAIALLRQNVAKTVKTLADALVPQANGKKRGIRQDSLEKMKKAWQLFDELNIAEDKALESEVNKLKALVGEQDAKALRASVKDPDAEVKKQFEDIRANIAKLVAEGPIRTIDFED